jgi:hypothetical protein
MTELLARRGSLNFARRCAQAMATEARAELTVELGLARASPHGAFLDGLVTALASRCSATPVEWSSGETRPSNDAGDHAWVTA